MRVSTAARAPLLRAQESSIEPQQLLLFSSESYSHALPAPDKAKPANDSPAFPFVRSRSHLHIVAPVLTTPPALATTQSFIFGSDGTRQWLKGWLKAEQKKGLPKLVAQIWESLIPWLIELSYYVINPSLTLAANIKQVKRIYEDTKKLRTHANLGLPDLDFDENIMECIAVALGTLPHGKSEELIMSLIAGEPSSLNLATGAIARNEAMHSLDSILTGIWNKRHRHGLTHAQLTKEMVQIMSYLYWEAGRSPLLDRIALTETDMGRLERCEREQYYSIFTEENTTAFLEHVESNINMLHQIRQHSAKRFSRFLIRDVRWTMPIGKQLEEIETKYRDYLDFA